MSSFWFPRFSPDGTRLTHEDGASGEWQNQWLDNAREIHHNGGHLVIAGVVQDGQDGRPGPLPAGSEIGAGGGKWSVFVAAPPFPIYRSWDTTILGGASPAINPDGRFAYLDDYQGMTKGLILDGHAIDRGVITPASVRMSRQALVWTKNGRTWGYGLEGLAELAREIQVAPFEFKPVPIDGPDGPWVLNHTPTGFIVRPLGEFMGYRLDNGGETYNPDGFIRGGVLQVVWTDHTGTLGDHFFPLSSPRVDLRLPLPGAVPAVGRPLWFGFFAGGPLPGGGWTTDTDPRSLPGNCYLDVQQDGALRETGTGTIIGRFVTGATVEAIERHAAAVLNPIAYWDSDRWPHWPVLPPLSLLCVRVYVPLDVDAPAFEAAVAGQLAAAPPRQAVAIVAQCYTSNASLTADLSAIPLMVARLARDHQNVAAVLVFSGSGRATGLQDHSEVRPLWEQFAAGVRGTPPIRAIEDHMKAPQIEDTTYDPVVAAGKPWRLHFRNEGDGTAFVVHKDAQDRLWILAENSAGAAATGKVRQLRVEGVGLREPAPPPPPPPPPPPTGVTISTRWGTTLEVTAGGRVRAHGGPGTSFEVRRAPDGRIGLTANGLWVAAELDGRLMCTRIEPSDYVPDGWQAFTVVDRGDGQVSLLSDHDRFVAVEADGTVIADRIAAGDYETLAPSAPLGRAAVLPLTIDGRMFRAGDQDWRMVFTDALTILTKPEAEARAFLDWAAATGFNGIRVFAGTLGWAGQTLRHVYDRLPGVLDAAAARGLAVEVTAITDSGQGWGVETHLREINPIVAGRSGVLVELANEYWHSTQAPRVRDPQYLESLLQRIDPSIPVALGAAQDDESAASAGGDYVTVHLDRGRDPWNMVRRVREMEVLSQSTGKPVVNNEPIKAGSQQADPAIYFTMGALNRIFEVGGVHHSDHGLAAVLPDGAQQALADAFLAGSHAIPTDERLVFKNATWADSPIRAANFTRVVRAYSGVAGARAWTVVLGLTGDPALELQGGWRVDHMRAAYPGVQLLALTR